MLRNRLIGEQAVYPDPIFGIDLRSSLEDLQPGQAELLQNCYFDGGLRLRRGSTARNSASLGAHSGRGGTKVYPNSADAFEVIFFNNLLATINSTAAIGTITTTGLATDTDLHFTQWITTDRTYLTNGTSALSYIENSDQTWTALVATNSPPAPVMTKPFVDRLFAITGEGVSSSNPRVDDTWASTSSTWAFYRPVAGAGNPTVLHLHADTGEETGLRAKLLIFQANAVSALTGTQFGDDVTAASAPTGWDAVLTTVSSNIGTESAFSLVTVPGIGTFWFTNGFNVAWLPFGEVSPRLIGDNLQSFREDIDGLNAVNASALGNVEMVYHDRKLKLALPVDSDTYSTLQFWLDIRPLQQELGRILAGTIDQLPVSWSGPHTGQSLRHLWVETQGGDRDALVALEGNSANGLHVYNLDQTGVTNDAVGSLTDPVQLEYRSPYQTFGAPNFEKYVEALRMDAAGRLDLTSVTMRDLHGTSYGPYGLRQNNGSSFSDSVNFYDSGVFYDSAATYGGGTTVHRVGNVRFRSQDNSQAVLGDALQVRVTHSGGDLVLHRISPIVQVRRTQQVR